MAEQTYESLFDDGRGSIACPRKGVLAIQRCHEWQAETEREGRACTCAVFLAYKGGEPAGNVGAVPGIKRRCGTVADMAPTKSNAQAVAEKQDRTWVPPISKAAKEIAEQRAVRATTTPATTTPATTTPAMPAAQEEAMPRPKTFCQICDKAPSDGSRLWGGVCKSCRKAQKAAKKAGNKKDLDQVAKRHAKRPAENQLVIPPVAQGDLNRLQKELAKKEARIAELEEQAKKIEWLAQGIINGFISPEQVKAFAKVQ